MIKSTRNEFSERDEKMMNLQNIQNLQGGSNPLLSNLYEERNIQKFSEEWRFVEFHLKSSLTTEVDIKRVITISNQHMVINFEKRAKNKLYTYAWFNFKGNSEDNNSINKLRSRGFEILPEHGMDFIVGSLSDENNEEGSLSEESAYVLCKIIIGRSYCKIQRDREGFSSYGMENSFKKLRPAGYDSIMFCPADSMSSKSFKSGWGASKSFVYRIFDSTNVLPMYWVSFSPIDSSIPAFSAKYMCAECQEREADYFCHNCEEYMCAGCYDQMHGESLNDKNMKEVFSHKKEVLRSKIKTGKCVFDPDKDVEFYCLNCKLTICSYCKVIGSHSRGEASTHQLQDISIAYANLAPETLEAIKVSESCRKKATDTLKQVKDQMLQLQNDNLVKAMGEISNAFEEEIKHLQAKSVECMLAHLSVMNELLVIKDSINWLDKYFTDREIYLKDNGNKGEFIWVWNHHNRMIQEIMHNKTLVNSEFKVDPKEFENIKMNELKIFHYRFEESSSYKEQSKEDKSSKTREGKKGVFDISQKAHNKKLLSITSKNKYRYIFVKILFIILTNFFSNSF
jgi:hypothetical protein